MTIATPTEVFDFMLTATDQRTTHNTQITNLIANKTIELEEMLGRKIESTVFTDVLFQNNLNCEIFDQELFLRGIYRDTYSITSISEAGESLTAITDYDDGNDYYLDATSGILIRNLRSWSIEPFAIKISGKMGLANADDSVRKDIKQIIIEMVAAASNIWRVSNDEGEVFLRTRATESTMNLAKKYVLNDL